MAGAVATRTLVLGVVQIFEPVNGYQVTRELVSWQVEDWAKLKPGSVYSMLTTLTKQGAIVRHDLPDGQRQVAVYELSADGREEFRELVRRALDGSRTMDRPILDIGLAFAPYLQRAEVLGALTSRLDRIDALQASITDKIQRGGQAIPPHVAHMLTLDRDLAAAERRWVADLRDRLHDGYLAFAGEPNDWMPAAGDPGWEMVEQNRRYREQIAALSQVTTAAETS